DPGSVLHRLIRVQEVGDVQIVDARSAARFRGEAPEPRAGLRPGHIPGSRNLPFADLLNPDKTMKDAAGIKAAFQKAGINLKKPIVTTCGSGVTAAILALGLERIGHDAWSLYDGSWAEWGQFSTVPVATGDA
ncbi:MAG: rhodanese-like domain-containing protein, partial [Pseudomonadota bacterium]